MVYSRETENVMDNPIIKDRTEDFQNGCLAEHFRVGLITRVEEIIESDDHYYQVYMLNPWSGGIVPRAYGFLDFDNPDDEDWHLFYYVDEGLQEDRDDLLHSSDPIDPEISKKWQLMVGYLEGFITIGNDESPECEKACSAVWEEKKRRFERGDLEGLEEISNLVLYLGNPESWPSYIQQ
jgi:hypothetical protein